MNIIIKLHNQITVFQARTERLRILRIRYIMGDRFKPFFVIQLIRLLEANSKHIEKVLYQKTTIIISIFYNLNLALNFQENEV